MITPPFDTEKELDLIRMMIEDKAVIPKVSQYITASDFYDENNLKNFNQLVQDYKKVGEINITNLILPISYLKREFVSSGWAINYAKELRELSAKRSVLRMLVTSEEKIGEWDINKLMNGIVNSLSKIKATKEKPKTLEVISNNVLREWIDNKGKTLIGLDTSTKLNDLIKGYRPAHY